MLEDIECAHDIPIKGEPAGRTTVNLLFGLMMDSASGTSAGGAVFRPQDEKDLGFPCRLSKK
jgi:hypothetical protein